MGDKYTHARPRDDAFYSSVADATRAASWSTPRVLPATGNVVHLDAGDLLSVALDDGAQIVHLDAWSTTDPTDRLWPHETSGIEGCFLGLGHRLWTTMPVFRPLLSVVVDTLGEPACVRGEGRHHLVLSGWDVPAIWQLEGGSHDVPTAWEHFRRLSDLVGVDPALHRDAISLFQRTRIDPATGRLQRLPSLADTGDRVVLFAEADVSVALVPSAWRGGGLRASDCDGTVAATSWQVARSESPPLGWPTGGVPYPDIARYVPGVRDSTGHLHVSGSLQVDGQAHVEGTR